MDITAKQGFEQLKGLTLSKIVKLGDDALIFHSKDGRIFRMCHDQDCCETVIIESIVGDLIDLLDEPILRADMEESEEALEIDPAPWNIEHLWTFYKLATRKGYVDIRWHGSSNGYYSVEVDFEEITPEKLQLLMDMAIDEPYKVIEDYYSYNTTETTLLPPKEVEDSFRYIHAGVISAESTSHERHSFFGQNGDEEYQANLLIVKEYGKEIYLKAFQDISSQGKGVDYTTLYDWVHSSYDKADIESYIKVMVFLILCYIHQGGGI